MSLYEEIQVTRSSMRGNAAQTTEYNILTLLVGELQTVATRDGSAITDEKVLTGIRKLIKSNSETLKIVANGKLTKENEFLEQYLPQQLTEEQIRSMLQLSNAVSPFKNIGDAMKLLNSEYAGQFDKGLAFKIAKEVMQ